MSTRVRNVLFSLKKTLINDKVLEIEIASTPIQKQLGLSFRDGLPENRGMIFIYSEPQILKFWMKNTRMPLDLAFINQEGKITEIVYDLQPLSQENKISTDLVQYALEVNAGWFKKNNINIGDSVSCC